MSTIAFLGLGAMGSRMATNLLAAGHRLRVWNRDRTEGGAFRREGARSCCASPAEAVQGAEFVVSIVADDRATRAVMLAPEGAIAAAAPGTVIVDSSTNTPAMAREAAMAFAARGVAYLDAPVSGSLAQAQNRELVFMVGGEQAAFARAEPVMAAMGRLARRIGPSGAGATLKLINNMISATLTAAIAEAAQAIEAAALDRAAALEILNEGAAGSRLMKAKLPKILERDFAPQFQLELMEKDLRYFPRARRRARATGADRLARARTVPRRAPRKLRKARLLGGVPVRRRRKTLARQGKRRRGVPPSCGAYAETAPAPREALD
ncbi:MAG: NAD(P)-dependent oxidoreductase [Burkholderiales bacterium]|nr:NAD(P)-dependent oxidoreductase [Burkholderiales bacterium]